MAEAVSRWPLTVEAWVGTQATPCGICGGRSSTVTVFLRVMRFYRVTVSPPRLHIRISFITDAVLP